MKKGYRQALALLLALVLLALPTSALTAQQARQLLEEHYVDPLGEDILSQPTVEEMLEALGDPYTEYMTPEEYDRFLATMEDSSLVGIGVSLPSGTTAKDPFQLMEVFSGGPADKGGLRPGDIIVAVDQVDVVGMDHNDIIAMIRGEEGTAVAITYLREDQRTTVTLIREVVTVPATTGRMLEGGVCYIQCGTWGGETLSHFRDIIAKYDRETKCWLIDLRGNPGGLTDAATDTAGFFCGPGTILYLRSRTQNPASPDGYTYELYRTRFVPASVKPVVILVDGNSASSSEAFTAALRDYGAAVVVGGRTYGKGVAQGLWDQDSSPDLFPEGGCLKLTIARFFSPNGNTNDTLGIMPDLLAYGQDAENLAVNLATSFAADPEHWRSTAEYVRGLFLRDAVFEDADATVYGAAGSTLRAYGLLAGKGDGLFHGEDSLTRAELAQMLVRALQGWIPDTPPAFSDVAADAWYADAVASITAQGMMVGTGEGRFSPDAVLTRQELFTVLGRLAAWLNDNLDTLQRQSQKSDWDLHALRDYSLWARPQVWLLSCGMIAENGELVNLLWSDPETIDPTAPATRGEAAQVLYNLLSYLGILPC